MIVKQMAVGTMANFVYLLVEEESREALVVDSGWETQPVERAARDAGATVKFAVATHGHFDHVSTLRDLAERLGAKVVAHESSTIQCDVRVRDGQELRLGSEGVRVLHTPGHTRDSICLYDGRHVFTGDTLFVGTIGRFEAEDAAAMYASLHDVIMRLPPSTVMFPGHDYGGVPSATLEEERLSNPFLMADDFKSFQAVSS